jgi:hypothetical protein
MIAGQYNKKTKGRAPGTRMLSLFCLLLNTRKYKIHTILYPCILRETDTVLYKDGKAVSS